MKKILFINFLIILISAGVLWGASTKLSAAAPGHSFAQVVPFSTGSGLLGFFDQSSGKVYFYDQDFKNCVLQLQISTLGQPIQKSEESLPKENKGFGTSY